MNLLILAIYVMAMIIISIIQLIIILIFPVVLVDDNLFVLFSSIINLLLYLSLFGLFAFLFRKYFRKQFADFKENKHRLLIIVVIGFLIMLVASVTSSFILEFFGITETSENQESLNMLLDGTLFDKIALFTFAVLLVPVVEELVFRKAILGLFHFKLRGDDNSKSAQVKKVLLATIAILISSFVFGFIHIMSFDPEQLLQIIYYAGLGAVLGIAYLVSNKNILVPITMHFLLNFMVTTILLFGF
jgi:membrane protease YdiL (CAAX protease family)